MYQVVMRRKFIVDEYASDDSQIDRLTKRTPFPGPVALPQSSNLEVWTRRLPRGFFTATRRNLAHHYATFRHAFGNIRARSRESVLSRTPPGGHSPDARPASPP